MQSYSDIVDFNTAYLSDVQHSDLLCHVYCQMITTVILVNIHHLTWLQFLVVSIAKWCVWQNECFQCRKLLCLLWVPKAVLKAAQCWRGSLNPCNKKKIVFQDSWTFTKAILPISKHLLKSHNTHHKVNLIKHSVWSSTKEIFVRKNNGFPTRLNTLGRSKNKNRWKIFFKVNEYKIYLKSWDKIKLESAVQYSYKWNERMKNKWVKEQLQNYMKLQQSKPKWSRNKE